MMVARTSDQDRTVDRERGELGKREWRDTMLASSRSNALSCRSYGIFRASTGANGASGAETSIHGEFISDSRSSQGQISPLERLDLFASSSFATDRAIAGIASPVPFLEPDATDLTGAGSRS